MNTTFFNSVLKSDAKNYFPIFFLWISKREQKQLILPKKSKKTLSYVSPKSTLSTALLQAKCPKNGSLANF
jgi:hypothetical protein